MNEPSQIIQKLQDLYVCRCPAALETLATGKATATALDKATD